ncbi:hypothetical protein HQ39_07390 [Porphyromonas sp. COT-108 OH2963]|nr:hypothetical protein HQ39_07390 [Porphyromonas sp. COT-108 OH2963]
MEYIKMEPAREGKKEKKKESSEKIFLLIPQRENGQNKHLHSSTKNSIFVKKPKGADGNILPNHRNLKIRT